MERVWKANIDLSPSCPRCGSSNTKFCYYNNYSLTQPRYFCKGCRRYWTKGGSLRNVPVGGGCRKSRRSRSIRVSTAEAATRATLVYGSGGNGGLMKAQCFDSTTGSSASPDGSHIDLALVYANYLNQRPESKGDLETDQEGGDGFVPQFTPNDKQVDPDIGFLGGNELLGCEFLSNFFAETNMNAESHVYHEGFGASNMSHERTLECDGIGFGNYSLPPLPNEEVMSWPDSRNDTAINGFEEPEFLPTVFGLEGQEKEEEESYIIPNWRDFDLPLDDAFRK